MRPHLDCTMTLRNLDGRSPILQFRHRLQLFSFLSCPQKRLGRKFVNDQEVYQAVIAFVREPTGIWFEEGIKKGRLPDEESH